MSISYVSSGDLFEKEEDIFNDKLWLDAGSEKPELQRHNRSKVAENADFIIPGHGPMFKVTKQYKDVLREQARSG